MPTHEESAAFLRAWKRMSPARQRAFLIAVRAFREDLAEGKGFRNSLRVKRFQGSSLFELTWAPDGRALWTYGEGLGGGAHIVWVAIGSHDIFDRPYPEYEG